LPKSLAVVNSAGRTVPTVVLVQDESPANWLNHASARRAACSALWRGLNSHAHIRTGEQNRGYLCAVAAAAMAHGMEA